MGTGLLILSGEVFNSRHVGGLLSVKVKLSGGAEGPVGGSEQAVQGESTTPGNRVVRGLEQS